MVRLFQTIQMKTLYTDLQLLLSQRRLMGKRFIMRSCNYTAWPLYQIGFSKPSALRGASIFGHKTKYQGNDDSITLHPQGIMSVCTKFHDNRPCKSCSDILITESLLPDGLRFYPAETVNVCTTFPGKLQLSRYFSVD